MAAIISLFSFKTACPDKLDGTVWRGKAMIPSATDVIIKFTEKGLLFYDARKPEQLLGLAVCESQDGSFISIQPESGLSACSSNKPWFYNVSEDTEGLKVVLIGGPCDGKGSILASDLYSRVVEKGNR